MGFGVFRYRTKIGEGENRRECMVREATIAFHEKDRKPLFDEFHRKAVRIKKNEIEAHAISLYSFGKTLDVGCGHRKLGKLGVDIKLTDKVDIVASGLHLPFRDMSFDTVISRHVIEHIGRFDTLLKEMHRITRSQVIISTPRKSKSYVHPDHKWHYDKEQWIKMLKTGFEIEDVLTVGVSNIFILNKWFLKPRPSSKQ